MPRPNPSAVKKGAPKEVWALNSMASQILAAAKEADAVKAAKKARVSRCPERDAVMEKTGAELHREQAYARKDLGGAPRPMQGTLNRSEAPNNRVVNHIPGKSVMNLSGVGKILQEHGLSLPDEAARILKGRPDPEDPSRTIYDVDADVRLLTLTKLMEYVYPKLRAVEMNAKMQLQGKAVDERLQFLLQKAAGLMGGEITGASLNEAMRQRRDGEIVDIEPEQGFDEMF